MRTASMAQSADGAAVVTYTLTMDRVLSTIGFCLFAAVSLSHFSGLSKIAAFLWPNLGFFAFGCGIVIWGAFLGMLMLAALYNRLKPAFGVMFTYVMLVLLAGMCFLPGVPAPVKGESWRDPQNLLTPQAEYILHNHSVVKKVLSRREFEMYSQGGVCYFTAGGMLLTAALCLIPIDRDNQLGTRKPRRFWVTGRSWSAGLIVALIASA